MEHLLQSLARVLLGYPEVGLYHERGYRGQPVRALHERELLDGADVGLVPVRVGEELPLGEQSDDLGVEEGLLGHLGLVPPVPFLRKPADRVGVILPRRVEVSPVHVDSVARVVELRVAERGGRPRARGQHLALVEDREARAEDLLLASVLDGLG